MLDRLKRSIVESYVGAVALGHLLAEVTMHFAAIFVSLAPNLLARYVFPEPTRRPAFLARSPLEDALTELIRFVLLLVLWYVLLRWLYFTPVKEKPSERAPSSEPSS